jgi:hypothetical protein
VDFPEDARKPTGTPAERMRACLAMYDEGVALQRLAFRRQHPDLPEADIDALLQRWLERADEE